MNQFVYRLSKNHLAALGITLVSFFLTSSLWATAETLSLDLNTATLDDLITQLKGNDTFLCDHAAELLAQLGQQAVEPLLKVLSDGHRDAQAGAMKALALIGDARAIEPIVNLLKNLGAVTRPDDTFASEYLRHEAIRALGDLKASIARDLLNEAAASTKPNDRIRALISLVKINEQAAFPQLLNYLKDSQPEYRTMVALGLGEIGGDAAVNALESLLLDPQWYVRDSVAESLGKINSQRARRLLKRLTEDANPFVQRTARHYLFGNVQN